MRRLRRTALNRQLSGLSGPSARAVRQIRFPNGSFAADRRCHCRVCRGSREVVNFGVSEVLEHRAIQERRNPFTINRLWAFCADDL